MKYVISLVTLLCVISILCSCADVAKKDSIGNRQKEVIHYATHTRSVLKKVGTHQEMTPEGGTKEVDDYAWMTEEYTVPVYKYENIEKEK